MALNYSYACMALACFLAVLISGSAARQFMVGGSAGWVRPASGSISYSEWAGKYHFLVGDVLVFEYNPSVDSVVRVSAEDYYSCTTSNPTLSFKDGITVFHFPAPGPFYFVSGEFSNCENGEKLVVVVLGRFTHSPSPAPAPALGPGRGHFSGDIFDCCQEDCCEANNTLCCQ